MIVVINILKNCCLKNMVPKMLFLILIDTDEFQLRADCQLDVIITTIVSLLVSYDNVHVISRVVCQTLNVSLNIFIAF